METKKANLLTRFEVIDHTKNGKGRMFVRRGSTPIDVKFVFQDDNRTLKVFLNDLPTTPSVHSKSRTE